MSEDEIVVLEPAEGEVPAGETTEESIVNVVFPDEMTVVAGDTFPVTIVDTRPFMTTHLDDYTVTEGLLLLILLLLVIKWIIGIVKEGFYWLW